VMDPAHGNREAMDLHRQSINQLSDF